ncbi:MAG TPA: hypothetical protein VJX70_12125 [Candidatus Acidoferrum sp.]|nr:hypothetical protein [Candidatus Acidoferrum sp.]
MASNASLTETMRDTTGISDSFDGTVGEYGLGSRTAELRHSS